MVSLKLIVKVNKTVRLSLIIILLSFVFAYLGALVYLFLRKTWLTPSTWYSRIFSPYTFTNFGGVKFNSNLEKGSGIWEISTEYAVLYKIEQQDKEARYYFSFVPYSEIQKEIKKMPVSNLKKRLNADLVFTLQDKEKYKPIDFLNHSILTSDSYTSLFASEPSLVPVRFNFKVNISKFMHPTLMDLVRHAYKVYIKKEKDVLPEELKEWEVSRVPFADEYFTNANKDKYDAFLEKWSEQVLDWYTLRVKQVLHKYDITQKEGRIAFFNKIADLFNSPYQRCSITHCTNDGVVSPGGPYLLYLYGLYYHDRDLFETLKEATYKHFTNYHPDYKEGTQNDKWGIIVPYVTPVSPVGISENNFELREFFLDTYRVLAERVKEPLKPLRFRNFNYLELPLSGWSDQETLWAISDSDLVSFYKYTKGKILIPQETFKQLTPLSKNLLYLILSNRLHSFKKVNIKDGKLFLFEFPLNSEVLARFVYNATKLNAYKGPFLQFSNKLLVDPDSLETFTLMQDKVLSLLLAYEIQVMAK